MRTVLASSLVAASALAASPAWADDTTERLTLPAARGLAQAFVEINLSKDGAFEPVSLAPDVWYGVNDQLTVGLVHSKRAATGFAGGIGDGLCLSGEDHGCADVYNAVGVDARYHLKDGAVSVAAEGGLFIGELDPFTLSLKAGAAARWHGGGKLAIDATPALFIGLTEREPGMLSTQGNKETLVVPVTFVYQAATKVGVALQTGVVVPFEATGDSWSLPVTLGGQYAVSDALFVEATFTLPRLAGGNPEGVDTTGVDLRTFALGGGYAF